MTSQKINIQFSGSVIVSEDSNGHAHGLAEFSPDAIWKIFKTQTVDAPDYVVTSIEDID